MAVFHWIGGSGSLDNSSNWSQPDPKNPTIPALGDLAIVSGAGITLTGFDLASGYSFGGVITLSGGNISSDSFAPFSGVLNIQGGFSLGGNAQIGFFQDDGTVNVTGSRSLLFCSTDVGYSGNGTLNVLAGGQVNADFINVGTLANSTGTVTVTGAGTVVNTTSGGQFQNIQIGQDGTASLTIQNQATVYTTNMQVAVDPQAGITDTLNVSNATLGVTQYLIVGMGGSATGTFDSGANVTAAGLIIGRDSGAQGAVTVDGSGTKLGITQGVSVGSGGTGTLKVSNSGSLIADFLSIGTSKGSSGTVEVTDAGTVGGNQFQNIQVGMDGTASLTIQDQAALYTTNMQVAVDPQAGITDTLNVSNATLGVTQYLIVGMGGSATGTFNSGANVTAGGLILGLNAGANGELTVDNSNLTVAGSVTVGGGGSGLLTIQDGGTLTVTGSTSNIAGSGNIVDNGHLVFSTTGTDTFSSTLTGNGTLVVQGGGTLVASNTDAFTGTADINGPTTLELDGAYSASINFTNANGILKLKQPASVTGPINGLQIGDIIDVADPIKAEAIDGSSLILVDTSGQTLTYKIAGNIAGNGFLITDDGTGGSNLTLKAPPALDTQSTELAGKIIDAVQAGRDAFLKGVALALDTGSAEELLQASDTVANTCAAAGVGVNLTVAGATLAGDLQNATSPEARYQALEKFDIDVTNTIAKATFVFLAGASPAIEAAFLAGLLGTAAIGVGPAVALALVGVALGFEAGLVYDQYLKPIVTNQEKQNFESAHPKGVGIFQDGYISGATVFADSNGNGQLDPSETSTTTDANGNFMLSAGTGPLVAFGGTDISTGLPFKGQFTAPAGSAAITPLTTLVATSSDQAKIAAALNLPSGINLTTLDPIAAAKAGDPNGAAVYTAGAKVYDTVSMIASTLAGAGGTFSTAVKETFAGIAAAIAGSGINLDDKSSVSALISKIAQTEHITLGSGVADNLATLIAASNTVLDQKLAADGPGSTLLTDVAGVELVAQGTESAAIQSAIPNPNPLITLVDIFTGSNLNNLVNGLPVAEPDSGGIHKGDTLKITAANGVLANDIEPNINDHLTVASVNGATGNVNHSIQGQYGSLTLNADGSYSYVAKNGSLPSNIAPQDIFAYSVSDGHGGTSSSTLTMTVLNSSQTYQAGSNKTLNGGNGQSVLDGTGGYDTLLGGNGADVLIGGPHDQLTGGNGPNIFVFGQHFGVNTITDFNVNNNAIQISKSVFATATDLLNHTADSASGAIITASATDQITLVGISKAQLLAHQSDFHFV